jgi:ATP-dependent Clp protease ATP-binding subunit ClpC
MKKDFYSFLKFKTSQFFQVIFNIFIFLPYYFSVIQLLKTFFKPWKNLVSQKTQVGFSFNEWFGRISFNLISSSIGLMMRTFLLITYFFVQLAFIFSLPLFFFLYFIYLPISYLFNLLKKTEKEQKIILKQEFLKNRLLKEENRSKVEEWFESYYQRLIKKTGWWQKQNLFSIPPLARDWSMGYTPTLDQFGTELTKETAHFKNLINREKEIQQIEQSLSKSKEANVLIIGDEGVGKHTIVEGLAKKIYQGKTNPLLAYKRIIKLDMEKIISQSTDPTQKEEILKTLFQEAGQALNIIIFIDDFDKYIASASDRIDLSSVIGQFAKSDKLQFIGISTPFFYQKFIFTNEKINRLFEKVDVFEISEKEAEEILLKTFFDFEQRCNLIIPYETIKEIIEKSSFYITDIPFPEKAIVLVDEVCVYVSQKTPSRTSEVNKLVAPESVDTVLTQKTHIPVSLDQSLKDKLLRLEQLLSKNIVFQNEAVSKLSSAIRKSMVLSGKRKKPLASFLFLGPTGVGKTETAKTLASVFFGSQNYLLRFDMSFYQRKDDIPNLLGSLDTGNPGLLTKKIRERPYGVLLLDEIEKADNELLNIFLTLLDEGYFTDGFGKRVDCKNLIVIATSNAGSDLIYDKTATEKPARLDAFNNDRTSQVSPSGTAAVKNQLINWLIQNHIFTPEFLNRFDGIIVYHNLTKDAIVDIAKKILTKISEEVYKIHRVKINISDVFLHNLVEKGYSFEFGARNMERVIRDEVEDKIAKLILENKVKEEETIDL